MQFAINSTAFQNGKEIPAVYTCQGKDVSPPLEWSCAPKNTKSLVLIVDDPDAPDPKASKMTWVHWVLYNIPATVTGLPEDAVPKTIDSNIMEGLNDWGKKGYGGPCPPIGRHRYFFKLYALDTQLNEINNPTKGAVESAMKNHVLAKAELIGTFEK